jgi:LacI family transcriptional regulator
MPGKKAQKRPTIFDLVKYTGISRGTISRAFNNQPGINPLTREKVLKAARKIGYRPHGGARMMKLLRKGRWGVLLPHLRNPYYSELVEALNREAHRRQRSLLLGLSLAGDDLQAVVDQWSAGETDGLIVDQSFYFPHKPLFNRLKEWGHPVVFLHGAPIPGFDFVRYEFSEAFTRNLRTLFALGHRRIGFVGQAFDGCRETGRFKAYINFLRQNGHEFREDWVYFGEDGHVGGIRAWERFRSLPEVPTAVVCGDDIIACGVIQAVRQSGLSVPKDLSVSGVDNIAEAERLGLTTIQTDRDLTSAAILDLLERRIEEPGLPPQVISMPSTLILRDSQDVPRK